MKRHPIVAKVSFGTPIAGPVLVVEGEGKVLSRSVVCGEDTLPAGHALTRQDVVWLSQAGVEVVHVIHGPWPTQQTQFNILRKAGEEGYVDDPEFVESVYPGPVERELVIVLQGETPEDCIRSEMVNWDINNGCAFCHSQNGKVAERHRLTPDNEVLDETYVVECVPFYEDERVKEHGICEYRKSDPMHGRPCAYKAHLLFSFPPIDGEHSLAIIETSSHSSAKYWREGLQRIYDETGDLRGQHVLLQLFDEDTIVPGGKVRSVQRTRIVPFDVESFPDELIESVLTEGLSPLTPAEMEAWLAEFNPSVYRGHLANCGLLPPDNRTRPDRAAYRYRRQALLVQAFLLPPSRYAAFVRSRRGIRPSNIEQWERWMEEALVDIHEDDRSRNFRVNSGAPENTQSP